MKRVPDVARRTVSARLPKPLVTQLKQLALSERRSVSAMIEILIIKAVETKQS